MESRAKVIFPIVITAIIVVSAVVAAVTAFVARPFARAVTLRVVGAIERAA